MSQGQGAPSRGRVIVAEDDVLLGVPARISESDQELRASGVSG
jgi:hypothetical protein